MAPHLTTKLHERFVAWHEEMGISMKEIAGLAKCSVQMVQNVLGFHRDYGVISNPHAKPRA
ncbi:hypothetical protein CPB84DRAFT_1652925, partial [Gymnopilus junonius]